MKGLILTDAIFSGDWFILWFSLFVIVVPVVFAIIIKIFTNSSISDCLKYGQIVFGSLAVVFLIFILVKTL